MKAGFYSKLAIDGIKKNSKLYIPYIITGIAMVTMMYIISFLSVSPVILKLKGGSSVTQTLFLGSLVIAVFSAMFLFYTNSFLIRRRKKEFGLYNIMGMSKKNISKIILFENLYLYLISVAGGWLFGTVFSKAAELTMVKIMRGSVTYNFNLSVYPFVLTGGLFAAIFFLLLLNSLRQIRIANPVNLLKSENTGEKKPKANYLTAIAGFIALAVGYYIALSREDPVSALIWFFVAVIFVIIATYLLFIAGSVLLCHILKKNKNYYYKKNHFASVSSMMFRMKRNGAGLASICILATMVLVMISSTSSLYFGSEDALNARYPHDIEANFKYLSIDDMNEEKEKVSSLIDNTIKKSGIKTEAPFYMSYACISGVTEGGNVYLDPNGYESSIDFSKIVTWLFIDQNEYNRITGKNISLGKGEALVYSTKENTDIASEYKFECGTTLKIKGAPDKIFEPGDLATNIYDSRICVIRDFEDIEKILSLKDENGNPMSIMKTYCGINSPEKEEKQIALDEMLYEDLRAEMENSKFHGISTACLAAERDDFYGTFGGLFFLGIILSLVFMFATVLIIYYKQITEGYEDQSRFEIMQKVGMTDNDIKKSINSQMLTVFFAPIIMAVIHLAAAFPAIRKILTLFNLMNLEVILIATALTVSVFAIFYVIVYKITSNQYYRIVKSAKS